MAKAGRKKLNKCLCNIYFTELRQNVLNMMQYLHELNYD